MKNVVLALPDEIADELEASPEARERLRAYAIQTVARSRRVVTPSVGTPQGTAQVDPWDAFFNAIPADAPVPDAAALTREGMYRDHD